MDMVSVLGRPFRNQGAQFPICMTHINIANEKFTAEQMPQTKTFPQSSWSEEFTLILNLLIMLARSLLTPRTKQTKSLQ